MGNTLYTEAISTNGGRKRMPDSDAKKKWMSENSIVFSVKFMRTTEADMIECMEKHTKKGIAKGTLIKQALREYMENHPAEGEQCWYALSTPGERERRTDNENHRWKEDR